MGNRQKRMSKLEVDINHQKKGALRYATLGCELEQAFLYFWLAA